MGSYQNIHIGPYVIAKHRDTVRTKHMVVCVNEKCRNHDMETKTNFCSQCGQEPQNKKFEIPYKENAWSFLNNNRMEDRLIGVHAGGTEIYKDREILTPNQHMPKDLEEIRLDGHDCGEIRLDGSAALIKKQTDWMLEEYEAELSALRAAGFEIEVQWGLVIHYS